MSLPEITALCRVLARSDAHDSAQQARNLERLVELNDYLRPHADPGMSACLEACTVLMGALRGGAPLAEREILSIVCRLMAAVEKHWTGTDPDVAIAESLYAGEPASTAGEPSAAEAHRIDSRVHGARAAVFQAGDIEEAQQRIDQVKKTPRISEMVLGELLVEIGHAKAEDIGAALDEQSRTGELLGEILVARGAVTRQVIDETVRLQVQLRSESTLRSLSEPPAPTPAPRNSSLRLAGGDAKRQRELGDDNMLGALLLRQGAITQDELKRAIELQRGSGLRLGEVLVDMRAAGWEAINRTIELQRRLRNAAGLTRRISF